MKSISAGKFLIRLVPVLIFAAGAVSGIYAFGTKKAHDDLRHMNEDIRAKYTSADKTAPEDAPPEEPGDGAQTAPPVRVDFGALRADGHNVIAWIYFPDTGIDYPVAKGEDNEYYLTHAPDGSFNSYGCIFADAACTGSFADANTVLYGHHMADGTMFAPLSKYKNTEYADAHCAGWVLTPEKTFRAYVYSCYVTCAGSEAYRVSFADSADFAGWLKGTMNNSIIPADINPDVSCSILTLSTCSYEFQNARCVVHAVLIPVWDGR